ncbi:hypothetical protein ABPG75_003025 [Micractinium tetrahymenae]
MARTSTTAEKVRDMLWFQRLRRRLRVWHRAVTRAAEEGGADLLAAALAAEEEQHGWLVHCPDLQCEEMRHTDAVEEQPSVSGLPVEAAVLRSPFPAASEFGILPYAAWHGHLEAVRAFIEARAPLEATALVDTEPYCRSWAQRALQLSPDQLPCSASATVDQVAVTALQIALYRRDAAMVSLLLQAGARLQHPHLLDVIRPRPGSLFASKAGSWSPRTHSCFPPAFKAAAAELLRISHKHGGSVRAGRLAWAFDCNLLVDLLLPALGGRAADWLDVPSQEGYRDAAQPGSSETMDGSDADTSEEEEEAEAQEHAAVLAE